MPNDGKGPQPFGRSSRQLLVDRIYGPFFWGKLLSAFGMWIQNITAAVVMFQMTGSSLLVATVSVVQFSGPLLLSMYAGSLSDRLDRRKLLIVGRLCSTTGAAWLSWILLRSGSDQNPSLLEVYLGLIALALGLGISSPAMNALVPALVPPEDLDQALALSAITGSLARSVGPAIGGVIIVAHSNAWGFALAAAMHASFVVALSLIRPIARRNCPQTALDSGVGAGLRFAIRDRSVGVMLLGVAALGVGIDPIITLAPAFSRELVGSSALVGAFAASFGLGAIIGVATLRRLRRLRGLRLAGVAGFLCLGTGLLIAAVTTLTAIVLLGFVVSGLGFLLGQTALSTRIHRRSPDHLRGRIMALWSVAFLGFRPVGAGINGVLADLFSTRHALLTSAAIAFMAVPLARHTNPQK